MTEEERIRVSSFVFDGTTIKDMTGSVTVMVGSSSDLTALTELVKPGAIAYTAGWTYAWQLDVDGSTWVPMIAPEED